jgi:putative membrane protein
MRDRRWPQWAYGAGEDPDYRFSFANERTFLAWVRTALALIAGGVAVDALDLLQPTYVRVALAGVLLALGLLCAASSWVRWARSERAIRRGDPLPSSVFTAILAGSIIVVVGVVLLGGL